MAECRWHAKCAYRDDDPDRCPWCHVLWSIILREGTHSCERAQTWSQTDNARTQFAERMREAVEQGFAPPIPNPVTFERSTAYLDLTGQQFGRLVVIERAGHHRTPGSKPQPRWRCRCSCGIEVKVTTKNLRTGETRSCGCLHRESARRQGKARAVDLIGQTFGKLTVIKRAKNYVSPKGAVGSRWRCRCSCGTEVVISRVNLGVRSTSCGCALREINARRAAEQFGLTGQVFGRLTVLGRGDDYHMPSTGKPFARWRCRCECGLEVDVTTSNLRQGRTRSCGCLQREVFSRPRTKQVVVGYSGAHRRITRLLGKASTQQCADCIEVGAHWTYLGDCPEELVQVGGQTDGLRYCLHPEHYTSRCIVHHRAYDRQPR